jgi:hypothetical protein
MTVMVPFPMALVVVVMPVPILIVVVIIVLVCDRGSTGHYPERNARENQWFHSN